MVVLCSVRHDGVSTEQADRLYAQIDRLSVQDAAPRETGENTHS